MKYLKHDKICLFDECEKKSERKGYCSLHHGRVILGRRPKVVYTGICKFNNCELPQKTKYLCDLHYHLSLRKQIIRPDDPQDLKCKVIVCNFRAIALGFCKTHYERIKRLGSTRLSAKVREKNNFPVDFTTDESDIQNDNGVWFKKNHYEVN